MNLKNKNDDVIIDYITGKTVSDVGAEANRQMVERLLLDQKGYARADIAVDAPISFTVNGEAYRSRVDLVVSLKGKKGMIIKCAAGSLGSREREAIAAARLLDRFLIPVAVVSDGRTALVFDTLTRRQTGEGLSAIPDRAALADRLAQYEPVRPLTAERRKQMLIFRSYDSMNVNVAR